MLLATEGSVEIEYLTSVMEITPQWGVSGFGEDLTCAII
jgi:hypothetical protein